MNIEDRVIAEAVYIIMSGCTIRECASTFNISKSTVSRDIKYRLPDINSNMCKYVNDILYFNKTYAHIRGGISTKRKSLNK